METNYSLSDAISILLDRAWDADDAGDIRERATLERAAEYLERQLSAAEIEARFAGVRQYKMETKSIHGDICPVCHVVLALAASVYGPPVIPGRCSACGAAGDKAVSS